MSPLSMLGFWLQSPPSTSVPPPSTASASTIPPSTISETLAQIAQLRQLGEGLLALVIAAIVGSVAVLATRR